MPYIDVKARQNGLIPPLIHRKGMIMKQFVRCAAISILSLAVFLSCSTAIAGEKKISKKEVPAAVLKSFTATYPHAKAHAYAKETEEGETFYELETTEGMVKRDILFKADGTIAEVEEMLTKENIPDAVSKTLAAEFPKGKILGVEKTTKGTDATYEAHLMNGKEKLEVVLSGDGKIQKKEVVKSKKAKGEKDEGNEEEDEK